MTEGTSPPIDFVRQSRAHLDSLRAAGVTFVPRGAPLEIAPAPAAVPEVEAEPAPPPDPLAERKRELTVLAREVAGCNRCEGLFSTRTQTVFGVGPTDPDVAFVGEAPGADEDRTGEPFVGKAGQLLTRIINGCGFKREEVYIFNTLKCRPPGNRTPTPEECDNCRPFFERQFDLVRPRHVVALGGTAAKSLLNTSTGITRLRGKLYEFRGVPLVCTFHPSALLRDESGAMKRDVWEDMKLLLRTMGREVPTVKKA
ncbi:uracil-DNA glycosylase [Gemmata sp.]|uniref:uracil-DNA glycosylase n=1 Tax=Gemmata sp. TaxID=1914242 RepID=UPI003F71A090